MDVQHGQHPAVVLAQPALGALAALAVERLGAEKTWCKVMTPNRASLRVAEKAGFTYSRTVAAFETGRGQHTDVKVFEMTRADYFEAPY